MALTNKWWISCVVSLSFVACLGSCDTDDDDGLQPDLFIFSEVCAMKEDVGPCKAIKERFFFDVDTGRCTPFQYGGCAGNGNNFHTLEACEQMCVVTADKSPCHLEEAPGPCRGLVTRFFFDSKSQECKRFFYGGCLGNANNFRSMADCQARCQNPGNKSVAPEVETVQPTRISSREPLKRAGEFALSQPRVHLDAHHQPIGFMPPAFCLTPIERGTCEGEDTRFGYNPKTRKCHVFRYSGCGGNKNHFRRKKQCMKTCMNVKTKDNGTKQIRIKKKNLKNIVFHVV
ncbi:tissue factor pathway inhibitor a isoform X2 [Lampris incognitus]|uniref:tissue factor pathway inhibitor a isoform X2 n=1 Tax=Lampris incognitus TaxID=2546036 RepID=UPI0024B61716|nr:tissue factor pathway inhibitor a isoform X2 [Lampris incognitus]